MLYLPPYNMFSFLFSSCSFFVIISLLINFFSSILSPSSFHLSLLFSCTLFLPFNLFIPFSLPSTSLLNSSSSPCNFFSLSFSSAFLPSPSSPLSSFPLPFSLPFSSTFRHSSSHQTSSRPS